MTNNLIQAIDKMIAFSNHVLKNAEKDDMAYKIAESNIQKLEQVKELAIGEQKHQEDWKARFLVLRAKHEGIMKAEQERIVKKLEARLKKAIVFLTYEEEVWGNEAFLRGCAVAYERAIKIVKNE